MSRIGRSPILINPPVQITVSSSNEVTVKGAKANQIIKMKPQITAKMEGNQLVLSRSDETRESRALHGLYRALIQNAVTGVSKGFTKTLELVGVGYRGNVAGKNLELSLGFSHPVVYEIPAGIEMKIDKSTTIHITGSDKSLVGQVAAKVRSFRPPEPFLGKGVKYADEKIRRKAGKAGAKA